MTKQYGPKQPFSEEIHRTKYRAKGESFYDAMTRVAATLKDNEEHFKQFREALLEQRFLPAGRVQAAIGSPKKVTPYNCFVSGTIEDSMNDIMAKAGEAATTMRLGGGIGYDFSTLRPSGDHIKSLDSTSSGPLSFMEVFNAVCGTISSAGHRRGAQMGVMRVDHPDILDFVKAKTNTTGFTNFNLSVGVTDKFMEAVKEKGMFELTFEGRVYAEVDAVKLWEEILRATWDWAEPGVLFIDRMNSWNNLHYCEKIAATNPCGEQPLPPYGACLLGSFNLVKYIINSSFDYELFKHDIAVSVRAMDNVVDNAVFPLLQQEGEARSKRRMGLGVTGLANAIEALGYSYGSPDFIETTRLILSTLRDTAYRTSVSLAVEKGPFPLYADGYLDGEFAQTLPQDIRDDIRLHGIRNSHLLSIAPTGTISLSADNVSSGLEPVFSYETQRTVKMPEGEVITTLSDYAYREWGVRGKQSNDLAVEDHLKVLAVASYYVDSACSKTCTVGSDVTWDEFKAVYMSAYDQGCRGCTTFRPDGKRFGVLVKAEEEEMEGTACYIDLNTGLKTCE